MSPGQDGEDSEPQLDAGNVAERRTLWWVLGINVSQVLLAGVVGVVAQSTGLLGAALDNLGDAAVYVVSLYAVGRSVAAKARAARLSGVLLIVMALMLLAEIIRRFVAGSDPIGWAMILTAVVNAATNLVNLRLLRSHRERGMHLKASWIFTTNDMIANLGIVASGVAELYDHQNDPHEWKNLANDPEHAAAKGALAKSIPTINAPDVCDPPTGVKHAAWDDAAFFE